MTPSAAQDQPSAALRRRSAPLLAATVLLPGLLVACDGNGLIGHRLSGNWCLPAGSGSGEALMLSLSGDGTGLMGLIPGTRPSIPLDWREDRNRLLLLQPGSEEVAYIVPIVADAQGQPELMLPGLGSLLNLNLHRCRDASPPASMPQAGWPGPPPQAAPPAGTPAPGAALDAGGAMTLAILLGGVILLLLAGAITMVILRSREDD